MLFAAISTAFAVPAAAASPKRVWQATLGTSHVVGSAVLTLFPNYTGLARVTVQGLKPATTYQAMIYKGTCRAPKSLVKLAGMRTDASGSGTRTTALSVSHGYAIWGVAMHGNIAVRVASGSEVRCSVLQFPRATRVAIPRHGIDLPIVSQPSGQYPYCNVAMYSADLSQPGEAGPTFIYAHARTGMFLPLLNASKVKDGAAMVGMTVKIWTSDSRLYTYTVTRVLRHQYAIPSYDPTVERLWLQTSEGPHGTRNKLFIVGRRVSVEAASYADSHPTPHIVVCGF